MAPRILTALVGIPLVFGAIWIGSPWLTILVAAASLLAVREFHRMAPHQEGPTVLAFGVSWTVLFIVTGQLSAQWYEYAPHITLGAGLALALPWLALNRNKKTVFNRWVYAVAGPIYVGFLLAHSLMLRELDATEHLGRDWLIFALLATFATDTGAFITGRTVGRHFMSPSISPRKTWEGAIGGFLWAMVIAVALGALLQLSVPMWQAALVGAAIGVFAQLGDLAESRLKRRAGLKEAGGLLPGHGGILDRIDSIVFTLPVVYYLVAFVLKPGG